MILCDVLSHLKLTSTFRATSSMLSHIYDHLQFAMLLNMKDVTLEHAQAKHIILRGKQP